MTTTTTTTTRIYNKQATIFASGVVVSIILLFLSLVLPAQTNAPLETVTECINVPDVFLNPRGLFYTIPSNDIYLFDKINAYAIYLCNKGTKTIVLGFRETTRDFQTRPDSYYSELYLTACFREQTPCYLPNTEAPIASRTFQQESKSSMASIVLFLFGIAGIIVFGFLLFISFFDPSISIHV